MTAKGLDHFRREFGNDQFHVVVVLAGDKGWRKFGDNSRSSKATALANEKRRVYLEVIPITLVALNGKGFKYEAGGEEKVGDKPAAILKVTGPDGKDFTLFFDKESGLPVKLAAKVIGFQGEENDLETTFGDYKDFDGIKKATKIEVKRDGETFQKMESPNSRSWTRSTPRPSPSPSDLQHPPAARQCIYPIHQRRQSKALLAAARSRLEPQRAR